MSKIYAVQGDSLPLVTLTITDAALVIGNTYHLAVKTANGWLGVSDGVTAS